MARSWIDTDKFMSRARTRTHAHTHARTHARARTHTHPRATMTAVPKSSARKDFLMLAGMSPDLENVPVILGAIPCERPEGQLGDTAVPPRTRSTALRSAHTSCADMC
jgi:hypothetical protein